MLYVAQHRFVAILRERGWRAPLIGTWSRGDGEGTAPGGATARWAPPPDSDDHNEKGTWSGVVVVAGAAHPDVAVAAEVAGLGEDHLAGRLSPQGRFRAPAASLLLARAGVAGARVSGAFVEVAGHRVHLSSGAVVAPDGTVRPRDLALAPRADLTGDPGLGRIVAEAARLAGGGAA